MAQHINLISKRDQRKSKALVIILLIGGTYAGLIGFYLFNQQKIANLQAQNQTTLTNIQSAKSELKSKRAAAGLPDLESLQQEINQAKALIEQNKGILALVEKGELGNRTGYSKVFTLLASVREPNLWITQIDVTKQTGPFSLAGNALSNESVMRYTRNLNQALKAFDGQPQLSAVDMQTQEFSRRAARLGQPEEKVPGVKFQLN
jgi:glucose/arabinose dehydrogenase